MLVLTRNPSGNYSRVSKCFHQLPIQCNWSAICFLLGVIRHKKGQMNSSIPVLNAAMADYYLNNGHNEEARQLFERLVSRTWHLPIKSKRLTSKRGLSFHVRLIIVPLSSTFFHKFILAVSLRIKPRFLEKKSNWAFCKSALILEKMNK